MSYLIFFYGQTDSLHYEAAELSLKELSTYATEVHYGKCSSRVFVATQTKSRDISALTFLCLVCPFKISTNSTFTYTESQAFLNQPFDLTTILVQVCKRKGGFTLHGQKYFATPVHHLIQVF